MATRTLTDTATISWDEATANQQKGNVIDDSITNAKLANVPTATIKGRATAGTGDPEDLTAAQVAAIIGILPAGYLFGAAISNNVTDATNDIDIATGKARSSDDTADIALASALTKRLDAAWAVGTNQGGRDTGSIADGWWYAHLIKRPDTGVVDVLFSLSATAPTMPANYTLRRRVAAFHRASGVIRPFTQVAGDPGLFLFTTPILDINDAAQGISSISRTMTVPPNMVWFGWADTLYSAAAGASYTASIRPTAQDDTDPGTSTNPKFLRSVNTGTTTQTINAAGQVELPVDSSSQIATRSSVASITMRLGTLGWRDYGAI